MREVMTTKEAAEYLGVTYWQMSRLEVPFVRLTDGGHRRYLKSDVDAWLRSRRETPVSAADVAARIRAKRKR